MKTIAEQIHGISDLEEISEAGPEGKWKFWHALGPVDEDELLRRLELHIDDLPQELKEDRRLVVRMIERRRILRDRILKEHPNIREHLEEKQEIMEYRLEKQNPEGLRKLQSLQVEEELQGQE